MAGKTGPSDTTTTTLNTPPTARVWNGDSSKEQVTAEEWIDQIQVCDVYVTVTSSLRNKLVTLATPVLCIKASGLASECKLIRMLYL